MGASNVKAVYAVYRDLAHAPFRVLAFMAVVSLDTDDPPVYFGGREGLALALGRVLPDGDDPATVAERRAALRAVDRTLRDLIARGAIKVTKRAAPGRNAHYAINLRPTLTVVRSDHGERGPTDDRGSDQRTTVSGPNEPRSADQRTTVSGPTNHGERGPEEYEEYVGLTSGIDGWSSRQPAGVARTREAAKIECQSCGAVLDPDGSCFACRTGGRAP